MSSYIVGIDLGTTYSCAAVWRNGKVDIIPLENGLRTMPSYVSFGINEYIVGESAKSNISSNPINTIYDAKRFIGKSAADICDDICAYPFSIINESNIPYFCVKYKNIEKRYSPEFISSLILSKIKDYASKYLEVDVTDVIITVPAYFNDAQRSATIEAGKLAGLNVRRIINEPTAASLAYGLDKKIDKNILVFDCGGGTHDVTILTITNGTFMVKATNGNTHLGGEDFDNKLFNYFSDDFNKIYNCDMLKSPKSIKKLKNVCERIKRELSEVLLTSVEIDSLYDGNDYITSITRSKFDELCCNLFDLTMEPVYRVLADANMKNTDIDEIVLVGGSTRIPAIRDRLSKYFGKKLNESVHPDEAVAYGAAVQGAIILDMDDSVKDIVMIDVTPLTLGVESAGGIMAKVIKRNTTIPWCEKKKFTTNADNQTSVKINIYQGERELVKDNAILGSFELNGILPAKRGTPIIEVSFDINVNGILCVSAVDLGSGNRQSITITGSHIKSEDEINRMVNEANNFKNDDIKQRELINSVILLDNYIRTIKDCLKTTVQISDQDNIKLNELFSKFDENVKSITIEMVNNIKCEIETLWNPIVDKLYKK